jgi:predicted AAA+ superfamily ATPase
MENIIFNELRYRGYSVDVGVVEVRERNSDGKSALKHLEVDFLAYKGSNKYYIQSAFAMSNPEKIEQEQKSLLNIKDYFKKIIIVRDNISPRRNQDGIMTIGILKFLLNEKSLEL